MKKEILLLTFIIAFAVSSFNVLPAKEFVIVGTWQSVNNEQRFVLTFDTEGYATLQKGNEVIGGKEFKIEGEKGCVTYSLDYTKLPNEIDITITHFSTGAKKVLKGIFKVVSNNEMLLVMDFNKRPENFDSADVRLFTRMP